VSLVSLVSLLSLVSLVSFSPGNAATPRHGQGQSVTGGCVCCSSQGTGPALAGGGPPAGAARGRSVTGCRARASLLGQGRVSDPPAGAAEGPRVRSCPAAWGPPALVTVAQGVDLRACCPDSMT